MTRQLLAVIVSIKIMDRTQHLRGERLVNVALELTQATNHVHSTG